MKQTPPQNDDVRLGSLNPYRRALFEKLKARRTEPESVPLSSAQASIWLKYRQSPTRTDYNLGAAFTLEGTLSLNALRQGFNALCTRHPQLCARIKDGDPPIQVEGVPPTLHVIEAENDPGALDRAIEAHLHRPFNLTTDPMLRVCLVRHEANRYTLLTCVHHLLCDGWSVEQLLVDFAESYSAALAGCDPAVRREKMAQPPLQASIGTTALEDWWRERLSGAEVTLLRRLADRPNATGRQGATISRPLSRTTCEAISTFAQTLGTTPFTVATAAILGIMAHRTGDMDFLVAMPVAGRNDGWTARRVGLYARATLLRVNCSGDPAFDELVRLTSAAIAVTITHAELPMERLSALLSRENARELAKVSVGYEPQRTTLRLPGLRVNRLELDPSEVPIELSFILRKLEDRLSLCADFRLALFDRATVEVLLDDISALLTRGLANPSKSIGRLMPGGLVAITPVQQQMWTGQKLAPESTAYNQVVVLDLPGRLEPRRFMTAWEAVSQRSDMLCARFVERDGSPRQCFAVADPPELDIVDLSATPARETAWREIFTRVTDKPFELDREVGRSVLARLGPDQYRWLLCVHHLCIDGQSFARLANAVLAEYGGAPSIELSPFEPVARNAAPDLLLAYAAPGELSFFGEPPLSLPHRTRTRPVKLRPEGRAGLENLLDLASRRSFSPAMAAGAVFVGIWAALLQRICRVSEVNLGFPVHNRTIKNETVVGPIMDVRRVTLPTSPMMTPAEFLAASQAAMSAALRSGSKTAATQNERRGYTTIVNVEPPMELDFDCNPCRLRFYVPAAWEPLTFHAVGNGRDWEMSVDFACPLFDEIRQAQILAMLEELFAAGSSPDKPIWDWNKAVAEARGGLHWIPSSDALDAFLQVVGENPHAPAIEANGLKLDYSRLAERAGCFASRLIKAGAGPGGTVAIRLPRTIDQVISWLAIWMTGATCQPLDPTLPDDITLQLTEAASTSLLIAQAEQAVPGMARIAPDEFEQTPPEPGKRLPALPALALATSGTIREHRVVLVTHGALAAYLEDAGRAYGIRNGDRVVQFAAPGFDTAAEEILLTLTSGATLLPYPPGPPPLPAQFLRWAAEAKATVLDLPTAYWHIVTAELDPLEAHLWPELRLVIVGGEEAGSEAWRRWRKAAPQIKLVNSYGPTETTIVTSTHAEGEMEPLIVPPPIGREFDKVTFHLLDEHLLPVPDGVPGELWIGGPQVSLGYVSNPGATAARFLPNPFSTTIGARIYHTGDLARRLPSGELAFLGRIDRETKISGRRVNCDVIERLLLSAQGVGQALVRPFHDGASTVLEAYLVPTHGHTPDAVRKSAADVLPSCLRLCTFIVEHLPLTRNGKVDRASVTFLLPVQQVAPKAGGGALSARINKDIASFAGCKPDQLDCETSIFSIGMDSLRMLQLVTRLDATLHVEAPIARLFDNPTPTMIAALYAEAIGAALGESAETVAALDEVGLYSRLTELSVAEAEEMADDSFKASPLPLLPAQEEIWALQLSDPQNIGWNVTSAIRLDEPIDIQRFRRAVYRLAERHEPLRTAFRLDAGRIVQEAIPAETASIPVSRIDASGRDLLAEARAHAEVEARRPFELDKPPLCRFVVVDDGRAPAVVIAIHHIVCDGWSAGIMVRELHALYRDETPLPLLATSYGKAVHRIRSMMEQGEFAHEDAFWRKTLDGLPSQPPPLTFDVQAAQNAAGGGATIGFPITPERLDRWRRHNKNGVTLHALLVATLAATLRRLGSTDDIAIGTPEAGRYSPEFEGLIGLFVNTLVLRVRMRDDLWLSDHLAQVAEVCRAALAHRRAAPTNLGRQFGRSPDRPMFRVMLTLLNEPTRDEIPSGWERIALERGAANRELTLRFEPEGDSLAGHVEYRTDLYLPETIGNFIALFMETFDALVEETGTLGALKPVGKKGVCSKAQLRDRLKRIRQGEMQSDNEKAELPVILHAGRRGRDAQEWIVIEHEMLKSYLDRQGAVLLRGFEITDAAAFERVARALGGDLAAYTDQSTPRTHISGRVYTSTEYPHDRSISMHNEMAHSAGWPRYLVMYCHTPAAEGGATPLANSRAVLGRLHPQLVERFRSAGVTYIRNFVTALDLPWTRVFGTTDQSEAEHIFAEQKIEWTWHGGDRLTLRQTRPATVIHPVTAEECWFNVAHIFHPSGQDPAVAAALRHTLDRSSLPRDATLGDGTPISEIDVAAIQAAYRAETVRFDWQSGDLLLIDNLLVAHGRDPFRGERLNWVAMCGAQG
jgi:amino acid adenylation domain-containing protein